MLTKWKQSRSRRRCRSSLRRATERLLIRRCAVGLLVVTATTQHQPMYTRTHLFNNTIVTHAGVRVDRRLGFQHTPSPIKLQRPKCGARSAAPDQQRPSSSTRAAASEQRRPMQTAALERHPHSAEREASSVREATLRSEAQSTTPDQRRSISIALEQHENSCARAAPAQRGRSGEQRPRSGARGAQGQQTSRHGQGEIGAAQTQDSEKGSQSELGGGVRAGAN